MAAGIVGAVLYTKDHVRVAAFYRDVLGLLEGERDADHSRLDCGGFDLIVHRIAGSGTTENASGASSHRRELGPIRLIFRVADVEACRAAAARMGGQLDDQPPPWAPVGSSVRLGQDPEGNVFEVRGAAG